jgi:diguanylate cyclase (GGDEF)-like protein
VAHSSEIIRPERALPAMVEVAKNLLQPLDLTVLLDEVISQIQRLFGYPICGVFLVDRDTQELYPKAQRGYDPELVKTLRVRIGDGGISGWTARNGQPYYAPDVKKDPLYIEVARDARSNVAFPLAVNEQIIGVLDVESPEVDAFPAEVRGVLEAFAALAALAIYRAQRDDDLRRLALTDSLTGLANHGALWETLKREIARAIRVGHPLSVVLVEIDKFKGINDRYGHLRGDEILRAVATGLKKICRRMDLAARFGGDEFVVILPDTPRDAALQVGEKLRRHVEKIGLQDGVPLTASVGVASLPDDGATADILLEASDRAMYQVKRAGGNRVGAM